MRKELLEPAAVSLWYLLGGDLAATWPSAKAEWLATVEMLQPRNTLSPTYIRFQLLHDF